LQGKGGRPRTSNDDPRGKVERRIENVTAVILEEAKGM